MVSCLFLGKVAGLRYEVYNFGMHASGHRCTFNPVYMPGLLVESPLISRQCDKLDIGHHQALSSVFFHGLNNIPDLNG